VASGLTSATLCVSVSLSSRHLINRPKEEEEEEEAEEDPSRDPLVAKNSTFFSEREPSKSVITTA